MYAVTFGSCSNFTESSAVKIKMRTSNKKGNAASCMSENVNKPSENSQIRRQGNTDVFRVNSQFRWIEEAVNPEIQISHQTQHLICCCTAAL